MKTQTCQIPVKKAKDTRKMNKSKLGLGISPNKFRNSLRRKGTEPEILTKKNQIDVVF